MSKPINHRYPLIIKNLIDKVDNLKKSSNETSNESACDSQLKLNYVNETKIQLPYINGNDKYIEDVEIVYYDDDYGYAYFIKNNCYNALTSCGTIDQQDCLYYNMILENDFEKTNLECYSLSILNLDKIVPYLDGDYHFDNEFEQYTFNNNYYFLERNNEEIEGYPFKCINNVTTYTYSNNENISNNIVYKIEIYMTDDPTVGIKKEIIPGSNIEEVVVNQKGIILKITSINGVKLINIKDIDNDAVSICYKPNKFFNDDGFITPCIAEIIRNTEEYEMYDLYTGLSIYDSDNNGKIRYFEFKKQNIAMYLYNLNTFHSFTKLLNVEDVGLNKDNNFCVDIPQHNYDQNIYKSFNISTTLLFNNDTYPDIESIGINNVIFVYKHLASFQKNITYV